MGLLHFLLLWTVAVAVVVMNELANFPPSIPLNRKLFDLVSEISLAFILISQRRLQRFFIRILILALAVLHDVGISGIFSKSAFCSKAYSLHWEQHSLNLGATALTLLSKSGSTENIYSEYGLNPKREFSAIPTRSWLFEKAKITFVADKKSPKHMHFFSASSSYFSSVLSRKNCFLFV